MEIRAVVDRGEIRPLDPLPPTWADGQELRVGEAEPSNGPEDDEAWAREMDALTAVLDDPAAWERIEAALREADQHAKDWVRREMGLP